MITQIELVNAIFQAISAHGDPGLIPRLINTVIRAADDILAELREPERVAGPNAGLSAWLASDRVGSSSLWMAYVLAGDRMRGQPVQYAYPHDPADFGRCLGLLEACPTLRGRLLEMATTGQEWAALITHWKDLEALFDQEAPTGWCPRLYDRMQTLLKGVTPAQGGTDER